MALGRCSQPVCGAAGSADARPAAFAALTSVERVHLDAARQRLVVEITLKDPEFFTREFDPWTLEFQASDLKLEPFNCSPEGVNGAIKSSPRIQNTR